MRWKPPNPWWVKLSDFGISKRAVDNVDPSKTLRGTTDYMAPELLGRLFRFDHSAEEPDSQVADMWALGEIAFEILTKKHSIRQFGTSSGRMPSSENICSAILRAHDVTNVGTDFIEGIMQPSPKDRHTAAQALLHAWLNEFSVDSTRQTSSAAAG